MKDFSKRNEMLSAFFDGELTEVEMHNLVKNISDEELAQLKKYHLIQAAAKQQLTAEQLNLDISKEVAAAIKAETEFESKAISNPPLHFWQRLSSQFHQLKPAVGFAVAATVTFFVVIGFKQNNDGEFIVEGETKPLHQSLNSDSGIIPVSAKIKQQENEIEPDAKKDDSIQKNEID